MASQLDLIAGVRVARAVGHAGPRARTKPVALPELQMQLAVVTAALLGDGLMLEAVEARLGEVDLVQHRERKRQNDDVGDHFARAAGSFEREPVPAVCGFLDPREPLPHLDDIPAKGAGHGFRQLLIAATDVKLLVRLAEDRQRVRRRAETREGRSG